MTKKKLAYEAPKTESQELRFEGIVCGSPQYGTTGSAGGNAGLGDDNYNYGGF